MHVCIFQFWHLSCKRFNSYYNIIQTDLKWIMEHAEKASTFYRNNEEYLSEIRKYTGTK